MPKWFLCPALVTLRSQIDNANPGRDKASDGSIGNADHSARKSDHNPAAAGNVNAIDVDEDLSPTIHSAEKLVNAIIASRDERFSYIIYEGRMIRSYQAKNGTAPWVWTKYTGGTNPHDHHFHISVRSEKKYWNDGRPWDLSKTLSPSTQPIPPVTVTYRKGDKGAGDKEIQLRLVHYGLLAPDGADGDFGEKTRLGVVGFQKANGLTYDGIVGQETRNKLFS